MKVVQVTDRFNHLIIGDIAQVLRADGIRCGLVSGDVGDLLPEYFSKEHLVDARLHEGMTEIQAPEADVLVVHELSLMPLAREWQRTVPTAALVHTVICPGGKLFRGSDCPCRHPMRRQCLVDWYAGPCGSNKRVDVAIRALRRHDEFRDCLRGMEHVWVLSEYMGRHLAEEGISQVTVLDPRIPRQRCRVAELRYAERIEPGKPVILYAGRFAHQKGGQLLIAAARHLGSDVQVVMIGSGAGGTQEHAWRDLAKELQVEVHFVPFLDRDELDPWLKLATVVVVPSLWPEPAGMAVPDAAELGARVVVTNRGGLPEWARYIPDIQIVEPEPEKLALAIEAAVDAGRLATSGLDSRRDEMRVTIQKAVSQLAGGNA